MPLVAHISAVSESLSAYHALLSGTVKSIETDEDKSFPGGVEHLSTCAVLVHDTLESASDRYLLPFSSDMTCLAVLSAATSGKANFTKKLSSTISSTCTRRNRKWDFGKVSLKMCSLASADKRPF